jgi:hypothetical protein
MMSAIGASGTVSSRVARTILALECRVWKFRRGGDEAVESAMICTAISISLRRTRSKFDLITHHVSHMVLTRPFLRNEALDAEEDNGIILNCMLAIVQTAQEKKALSIM